MTSLKGKTALVTGAGQGIGRACAVALAEAGARVAVVDLKLESAEATVAALPDPARHLALTCNVADSAAVKAAFARVQQAFGRLDVLVNNAGTGTGPNDGSAKMYELMAARNAELARGEKPKTHVEQLVFMEDEDWHPVMRVNLDGAFYTAQEAVKQMVAQDPQGGSVVFTTSGSAKYGQQRGQHYAGSKGALISMMKGIAVEHARHGIRCNAILPGWIESEMTAPALGWDTFVQKVLPRVPMRRWGSPDDFAGLAVYLASRASSYHTGDVITIDGGYHSMRSPMMKPTPSAMRPPTPSSQK